MIKIFVFLLGVVASQWFADALKASSGGSTGSWMMGFATQYICCVFLLAWFDQANVVECLRSGVILILFVRWVYFMKRLK